MVNTFLVGTIAFTCAVLDNRRLNKQLVEAHQILSGSWSNHPAAKMWLGFYPGLKHYANSIREEVIRRGIKCSLPRFEVEAYNFPWWFDWQPFHETHIASLLRKDPNYYGTRLRLSDVRYADVGYIWPTDHTSDVVSYGLTESIILCRPIGAGAPATYRWSREDVIAWLENPDVNPKTHRKINPNAKKGVAADLRKAAKLYNL